MQDGWQVYTPMLDHGHKTDLLVTDGERHYPIQVKAIEAQDEARWLRTSGREVR